MHPAFSMTAMCVTDAVRLHRRLATAGHRSHSRRRFAGDPSGHREPRHRRGAATGCGRWLPALDVRKTTDSLGVFHFEELPVGPQLVQTRRIGYLIQRDTLTLVAGRETRREYAMMAQGTMLDTVRTTADQSKNISPALRASRIVARRGPVASSGVLISERMMSAI